MPRITVNPDYNETFSQADCVDGNIECGVGKCIPESTKVSATVGAGIGAIGGIGAAAKFALPCIFKTLTDCAPAYCGCAFGFVGIVFTVAAGAAAGAGAGILGGGTVGGTVSTATDAACCVKNTVCHGFNNSVNNSINQTPLIQNQPGASQNNNRTGTELFVMK